MKKINLIIFLILFLFISCKSENNSDKTAENRSIIPINDIKLDLDEPKNKDVTTIELENTEAASVPKVYFLSKGETNYSLISENIKIYAPGILKFRVKGNFDKITKVTATLDNMVINANMVAKELFSIDVKQTGLCKIAVTELEKDGKLIAVKMTPLTVAVSGITLEKIMNSPAVKQLLSSEEWIFGDKELYLYYVYLYDFLGKDYYTKLGSSFNSLIDLIYLHKVLGLNSLKKFKDIFEKSHDIGKNYVLMLHLFGFLYQKVDDYQIYLNWSRYWYDILENDNKGNEKFLFGNNLLELCISVLIRDLGQKKAEMKDFSETEYSEYSGTEDSEIQYSEIQDSGIQSSEMQYSRTIYPGGKVEHLYGLDETLKFIYSTYNIKKVDTDVLVSLISNDMKLFQERIDIFKFVFNNCIESINKNFFTRCFDPLGNFVYELNIQEIDRIFATKPSDLDKEEECRNIEYFILNALTRLAQDNRENTSKELELIKYLKTKVEFIIEGMDVSKFLSNCSMADILADLYKNKVYTVDFEDTWIRLCNFMCYDFYDMRGNKLEKSDKKAVRFLQLISAKIEPATKEKIKKYIENWEDGNIDSKFNLWVDEELKEDIMQKIFDILEIR